MGLPPGNWNIAKLHIKWLTPLVHIVEFKQLDGFDITENAAKGIGASYWNSGDKIDPGVPCGSAVGE